MHRLLLRTIVGGVSHRTTCLTGTSSHVRRIIGGNSVQRTITSTAALTDSANATAAATTAPAEHDTHQTQTDESKQNTPPSSLDDKTDDSSSSDPTRFRRRRNTYRDAPKLQSILDALEVVKYRYTQELRGGSVSKGGTKKKKYSTLQDLRQEGDIILRRLFSFQAQAPTKVENRLAMRDYRNIFFFIKTVELYERAFPFFQLLQLHLQLKWKDYTLSGSKPEHLPAMQVTARVIGLVLESISASKEHGPQIAVQALQWMNTPERQKYFDINSSHFSLCMKGFWKPIKEASEAIQDASGDATSILPLLDGATRVRQALAFWKIIPLQHRLGWTCKNIFDLLILQGELLPAIEVTKEVKKSFESGELLQAIKAEEKRQRKDGKGKTQTRVDAVKEKSRWKDDDDTIVEQSEQKTNEDVPEEKFDSAPDDEPVESHVRQPKYPELLRQTCIKIILAAEKKDAELSNLGVKIRDPARAVLYSAVKNFWTNDMNPTNRSVETCIAMSKLHERHGDLEDARKMRKRSELKSKHNKDTNEWEKSIVAQFLSTPSVTDLIQDPLDLNRPDTFYLQKMQALLEKLEQIQLSSKEPPVVWKLIDEAEGIWKESREKLQGGVSHRLGGKFNTLLQEVWYGPLIMQQYQVIKDILESDIATVKSWLQEREDTLIQRRTEARMKGEDPARVTLPPYPIPPTIYASTINFVYNAMIHSPGKEGSSFWVPQAKEIMNGWMDLKDLLEKARKINGDLSSIEEQPENAIIEGDTTDPQSDPILGYYVVLLRTANRPEEILVLWKQLDDKWKQRCSRLVAALLTDVYAPKGDILGASTLMQEWERIREKNSTRKFLPAVELLLRQAWMEVFIHSGLIEHAEELWLEVVEDRQLQPTTGLYARFCMVHLSAKLHAAAQKQPDREFNGPILSLLDNMVLNGLYFTASDFEFLVKTTQSLSERLGATFGGATYELQQSTQWWHHKWMTLIIETKLMNSVSAETRSILKQTEIDQSNLRRERRKSWFDLSPQMQEQVKEIERQLNE